MCPLGHTALHVMSTLRDGTLSESAARLVPGIAIRCCCVGTVLGFDAPARCPSNGVMTGRPLLSTGSLGWFPRFIDTLGRSDSPPFVSTRSNSSRADTTVSPVVCSPRSWASHRGPGSCRFRSPIRGGRKRDGSGGGRGTKAGRGGRKRDGSDIGRGDESGTGPILGTKAGRVLYCKLGGPADVRAIFTRARHFDFGPPFAGDPWDDRPTLGPNVSRFPSAIPAGQRGGLVARSGEALPVPARRRFD